MNQGYGIFVPELQRALTFTNGGHFREWSLETGTPTPLREGQVGPALRAAASAATLVVARQSEPFAACEFESYDYETLTLRKRVTFEPVFLSSLAVGRHAVALASVNETIVLLNQELEAFDAFHCHAAACLAFDAAGESLAALSTDQGGGGLALYRRRGPQWECVTPNLEPPDLDLADTFATLAFDDRAGLLCLHEVNQAGNALSAYDLATAGLRWRRGLDECGERASPDPAQGFAGDVVFDDGALIAAAPGDRLLFLSLADGSLLEERHVGVATPSLWFDRPARRLWSFTPDLTPFVLDI